MPADRVRIAQGRATLPRVIRSVLDQPKPADQTGTRAALVDYRSTHVKEAAALMSPVPLYRAHLGKSHSGLVRPGTPTVSTVT